MIQPMQPATIAGRSPRNMSALVIPPVYFAQQRFDSSHVEDVASVVAATLDSSGIVIPAGEEIALAVGSRGITALSTIVRSTADWVKGKGGKPFIVPAMGSHGGATNHGQAEVLASYGITEMAMSCPIRSEMQPVALPRGESPVPVYLDRHIASSAGAIVINRIKVHTDYHGPYESGLMKMMAIGMGKHAQALAIHQYGVPGLREIMPRVAQEILKSGKVLGGLGLVENAYDQPLHLEAIPASHIPRREPELLDLSRRHMPSFPLDEIDLLVVDQIGKNISGVGMDPNIIGRMGITGEPEPNVPNIGMIIIRDLTEESHGNALGMGLADICTRRFHDKVDLRPMYENIFTSTFLQRGKIPIVAETDEEAFAYAVRALWCLEPGRLRIVRIRDTLHLSEMLLSQAALNQVRPGVALTSDPSQTPLFQSESQVWNG